MNESMDRVLSEWLHEGPDSGPRAGLERALAATRRVGQRPGWTFPERWLPMQLTMARTRSQRPILAIVVLASLIVALVATTVFIGSQRRLSPPLFRNGAIVYEEGGDLFVADQLGGTPRALVAGRDGDARPVFSPHGDRIAFVRTPWVDGEGYGPPVTVMTVRTDGSGLQELAQIPERALFLTQHLVWAPDGSAILAGVVGAFDDDASGALDPGIGPDHWWLLIINADGSGSRMIDPGTDVAPVAPAAAAWRPDGRHIAFLGLSDGAGIFIADAAGTVVHRLPIEAEEWSDAMEWSPDGTRLSFVSVNGPAIADIDADGNLTATHQLPFDSDSAPMWSPDGSLLALMSGNGSQLQVEIFQPDGSGARTIGPALARPLDAGFSWSPDGRSIVITGHVLQEDPDTLTHRWTEKTWSVDVTTGKQIEVQSPVDSWQRIAP